jgi:peptidoglycan hydrolase-like protein with peptidoglycan-binding domain
MILRFGDVGGGVKHLQRGLNRLGSLLLVDGQFGTGMRDAVDDARTALCIPGSADRDKRHHD